MVADSHPLTLPFILLVSGDRFLLLPKKKEKMQLSQIALILSFHPSCV